MDSKLKNLLNKHIKESENKFKRIPKSNKHRGMMAVMQNMLEDKKNFMDKAEKIVNKEHRMMIDYINTNLLDDYTQEELDHFMEIAKERFLSLLQDGFRDA